MMSLPSIFLIATVVGTVTFLFLFGVRLKREKKPLPQVQDLLTLVVEALLYTGFVTSGIADIYFGFTGSLYPGVDQSEFGPQIIVTGLALIVAAPTYIYQRVRPKRLKRGGRVERNKETLPTRQPDSKK